MIKDLTVTKSIEISANAEAVWDALINPEKIKIYLFGTNTSSDWKVGSTILFSGEYDGQRYEDKGNVLESDPFKTIQYNYLSGFSGLEDKLENYSIITYKIEKITNHKIQFTWIQKGFANEQGYQHTENSLLNMLEQIKVVAEKG